MELPKGYIAKDSEPHILKRWEASGFANPDKLPNTAKREPYSITLPPPNATSKLHLGHAVMVAIQDLLIRFERMRGKKALWLPGTDHAAIATQNAVEKELKKEGKRRQNLGREAFLKRVEGYVESQRGTIKEQIRRMGASCDWSRERFTLDAHSSEAVTAAFDRLYEAGLIYRGNRIVNWCPRDRSTLADDEVEYVEKKAPFYYFRYGPVVIGTARPETKFGDKVIVVHPDDKRYKHLVGKTLTVDWILGPIEARVVADAAADPELGTGAMTITPAHSFVDFELAKKHGIEIQKIIDEDGNLTDAAGPMKGVPVKEAREKVVAILKEKGLLERIDENYVHNLSVCYRCGAPVEPLPSEQWFIAVDKPVPFPDGSKATLKEKALKAVTSGETRIVPEHFTKTYTHWLKNLHDWCISRQIWYGHRVPVWTCVRCGNRRMNPEIKARWFLVRHGETDWNREPRTMGHEDIPLNENGRHQARAAADALSRQHIDLVVSSDLLRAKETAEIIAKKSKAELVLDPQLRERFLGKFQGKSIDERRPHEPVLQSYEGTPEGAESYQMLEERVWQTFVAHRKRHTHKNVIIVTHGGPIKHILKRLKQWTHERALEHRTRNAEILELDVLDPCEQCGEHLFEQDPDTLDTWFSSSLWTFSTLGWPKETKDLKAFHPTDVMETGYDILFFWVARMILMSTFLMGEIPFKAVYLHGLVRDKQGRKMSKSLGNGIDPLEMAEKYGADAVRLSLIIGTSAGNDQRLAEDKIAGFRNYANKVWNIGRFVLLNPVPAPPFARGGTGGSLSDRWITNCLNRLIKETTAHLERFEFSQAGEKLYDFAWHEFADWYLEIAKVEGNHALAREVLETVLKLLHPFMPFVTEALWEHLKGKRDLLMIQEWPKADEKAIDEKAETEFKKLQERVTALRIQRKEAGLTGKIPLEVKATPFDREHRAIIERLAMVRFQ